MTINNLGQIISARGGQASTQRAATAVVSCGGCRARGWAAARSRIRLYKGAAHGRLLVAASPAGALAVFLFFFIRDVRADGALLGVVGAAYETI